MAALLSPLAFTPTEQINCFQWPLTLLQWLTVRGCCKRMRRQRETGLVQVSVKSASYYVDVALPAWKLARINCVRLISGLNTHLVNTDLVCLYLLRSEVEDWSILFVTFWGFQRDSKNLPCGLYLIFRKVKFELELFLHRACVWLYSY